MINTKVFWIGMYAEPKSNQCLQSTYHNVEIRDRPHSIHPNIHFFAIQGKEITMIMRIRRHRGLKNPNLPLCTLILCEFSTLLINFVLQLCTFSINQVPNAVKIGTHKTNTIVLFIQTTNYL